MKTYYENEKDVMGMMGTKICHENKKIQIYVMTHGKC